MQLSSNPQCLPLSGRKTYFVRVHKWSIIVTNTIFYLIKFLSANLKEQKISVSNCKQNMFKTNWEGERVSNGIFHSFNYYIYDALCYLLVCFSASTVLPSVLANNTNCLIRILFWMLQNKLKWNVVWTEYIILPTKSFDICRYSIVSRKGPKKNYKGGKNLTCLQISLLFWLSSPPLSHPAFPFLSSFSCLSGLLLRSLRWDSWQVQLMMMPNDQNDEKEGRL